MHKHSPKFALIASASILVSLLCSCSTLCEPRSIDPATGRLPYREMSFKGQANVVKSESIDLSRYKGLVLVLGGDYFRDQVARLGIFDTVVDREGMEKALIKAGKDGEISDVTNQISWKKIFTIYKPFLVIKPDTRNEGRSEYFQFKVITPDTADEVFVAESKVDVMWKGVNDDALFVPLFNAFLDWADQQKAEQK